MELVGEIGNARACKAFSDYLITQGIQHQVSQQEQRCAVYVEAAQLEQATQLYQEFVHNPNQQKYLQASWQVNNPVAGTTQNLGLAKIWQANGPLTKFIAVLCVAIFALSYFGYFRSIFTSLSFSWQLDQAYRLFTPAVMHLSAVHLAFNMSWWWYLGGKVENNIGIKALALLTLVTAVMSNIAQALLVDHNFAGLSGVNYGLAGFVWLYGRLTADPKVNLANNIFGFLLVWMLLGFTDILPIGMANWAHLFGLLSGMALAQVLYSNKKADR